MYGKFKHIGKLQFDVRYTSLNNKFESIPNDIVAVTSRLNCGFSCFFIWLYCIVLTHSFHLNCRVTALLCTVVNVTIYSSCEHDYVITHAIKILALPDLLILTLHNLCLIFFYLFWQVFTAVAPHLDAMGKVTSCDWQPFRVYLVVWFQVVFFSLYHNCLPPQCDAKKNRKRLIFVLIKIPEDLWYDFIKTTINLFLLSSASHWGGEQLKTVVKSENNILKSSQIDTKHLMMHFFSQKQNK